jgi:hypothetical protein
MTKPDHVRWALFAEMGLESHAWVEDDSDAYYLQISTSVPLTYTWMSTDADLRFSSPQVSDSVMGDFAWLEIEQLIMWHVRAVAAVPVAGRVIPDMLVEDEGWCCKGAPIFWCDNCKLDHGRFSVALFEDRPPNGAPWVYDERFLTDV